MLINPQKTFSAAVTESVTTEVTPKVNPNSGLCINPRVSLVPLSTVRVAWGCDAESVFDSVGDATHPKFLRWVFNIATKPSRIRELRFWRNEIFGTVDKWAAPEGTIEKILGIRTGFPRGEIEICWMMSAPQISRLIRVGEIAESNRRLTRASLAAFLKRRLQ